MKDFFEAMRVHSKYLDAVDLEEYLQHTMQRYLDEADKLGVAESVENTLLAKRVKLVRDELARLRDPKSTAKVHEHRQQISHEALRSSFEETAALDDLVAS